MDTDSVFQVNNQSSRIRSCGECMYLKSDEFLGLVWILPGVVPDSKMNFAHKHNDIWRFLYLIIVPQLPILILTMGHATICDHV